jgi:hypothetical protein
MAAFRGRNLSSNAQHERVRYDLGVTDNNPAAMAEVRELVDEYRASCLWFLRRDYQPATREEALRVLDAIARHGDVAAFRRAERLRAWLSPTSSAPSVAS